MKGRFWRRHGVTSALVALALGLSLYTYVDRENVTTGEREERKGHLFPAFRSADLSAIRVRRGAESYALRRTPGARDVEGKTETRWQLDENGRTLDADPALADRFVAALEFAAPDRRLPGGVERAPTGLDAPRLVIEIDMGKLSPRLAVGGPAPRPEHASYAEADGTIVVLRQETVTALDQPADAFLPRSLVPYLSTDLARIELGGEGGERTLERDNPQGPWRLARRGLRAARAATDRISGAFADLRADAFLKPDEAQAAQAGAPLVTLSLVHRDPANAPARFVVGGACPGRPDDVVLRRLQPEPLSACVARGAFDALAQAPDALTDRRAFFARDDEVEELLVEGPAGGPRLELARKGGGWRQRAPEEADVPRESALALVKALASAEGEGPLPPGAHAASFDPPRGKVTIHTAGLGKGGPSETVEVGAPLDDGRVPLRRADGAVIVVAPDVAANFGPRPLALRPRGLLALAPEAARRLEVEGQIRQIYEKNAEGHWRLVEPKGLPVDLATAAEAASAFGRLEAERWVAEAEAPAHGLSPPRLAATLAADVNGAPARHRLVLGADTAGGLFARLDAGPVFVAPRAVADALSAWAIDRAVFAIDAADVDSVTLKGERAELTLVARGDHYEVGRGPALSPARLSALRDALQGLTALAALHPGKPAPAEGLDRPRLTLTVRPKGEGAARRITVGAGDEHRGASMFYARHDGVDATYALPAARVRALLDAL